MDIEGRDHCQVLKLISSLLFLYGNKVTHESSDCDQPRREEAVIGR